MPLGRGTTTATVYVRSPGVLSGIHPCSSFLPMKHTSQTSPKGNWFSASSGSRFLPANTHVSMMNQHILVSKLDREINVSLFQQEVRPVRKTAARTVITRHRTESTEYSSPCHGQFFSLVFGHNPESCPRAVRDHNRLPSARQGGKGMGKRHLPECGVVRSQDLLRESGLGAYCTA